MGIRILVSVIATLAALHAEAVTLPAVVPLELADLTLQVPPSKTTTLRSSVGTSQRNSRQSINSARWLNERQTFVQEQRWVF